MCVRDCVGAKDRVRPQIWDDDIPDTILHKSRVLELSPTKIKRELETVCDTYCFCSAWKRVCQKAFGGKE